MKKTIWMIILGSLSLIVVLYFVIFGPRLEIETTLKNISKESDNIPCCVINGRLHMADKNINISQILRNQNEGYALKEIFCVTDGKVYFVYSIHSTTVRNWVIASINLETGRIEEHSQFTGPKEIYQRKFYAPYQERNGYYYDGQIVLSDSNTVLVYNLGNDKQEQYSYDIYSFPQQGIYGEIIDSQTVNLHIQEDLYSFNLHDMSETSKGVALIYSLRNKRTWNGTSYLPCFFSHSSIQVVANKVYAVCAFVDFSGSSYAVILEYDREQKRWLYVTHSFSGGNVHGNCYVVAHSTHSTGDGLCEP